ncbi:MAG: PAS domain S-box protein, partial [Lentisphaeria bacterium]|nr:PAS domain S-box protein [Lentisphaeria bacterium]
NSNYFEFGGEWLACAFDRDISERRQREEELAASRRMLREVLDTIPVRVFWKDREGRIMGCNRQFARDAGMADPEDAVGLDDFSLAPREEAERYRADDREVMDRCEAKIGFEEPRTTPGGRSIWLRTSKIPLRDERGGVYGILGVYEDITERHLAEAGLRESHERLLAVLNNMDAAIYIADMRSHEILFINEYGARKWGRDLVGRKCWQVLQRQPGPCSFCTNSRLVDADGQPGEVVHWERQSQIDGRWYEMRDCAIRWTDGRLVRMQVATDIADRKLAEQLLAAKNKELEQIVYVASHDLRSPLVNVDGYSRELEFAVEDLHSALVHGGADVDLAGGLRATLPEMVAALRHIRNSTRQMDTLLKGLLKLSRTGRAALQVGPVDMNVLLVQVVAGLEFQVRESGAAVHVGDLPPCLGDEIQLGQVFQNLIGNALKFLDPARPGVVRISGSAEQDRSVYCVEDNGIGIAPEHQNIIFELFHRLDPGRTEGEGLGLTIVRQILGRLDGEIQLESQLGEGSRFRVALPSVRQLERNGQE